MLERSLVHVLSSDAHDVRHRPPVLADAVQAAGRLIGSEAARRLVDANPRAILEGRELETPEEPPERPAGFLSRLASRFSRRG
jgi:protein-tyrosine phosphatase